MSSRTRTPLRRTVSERKWPRSVPAVCKVGLFGLSAQGAVPKQAFMQGGDVRLEEKTVTQSVSPELLVDEEIVGRIQSDLATVNLVSAEQNERFDIELAGCTSHARRPFAIHEDEDP